MAVYARELRPELLRALPSRPAFARRRAPCCLRAHTTLTTSQLTQLTHLLNPTQARNNTLATSNAHLFSKISTILFAARFRNTSRSNAGSTALMAFNIRYGVAFTLLLALVCAQVRAREGSLGGRARCRTQMAGRAVAAAPRQRPGGEAGSCWRGRKLGIS